MATACSLCGVTAGGDTDLPTGWSVAFECGRTTYQCPDCVRANIRAIEGKLPEEWW